MAGAAFCQCFEARLWLDFPPLSTKRETAPAPGSCGEQGKVCVQTERVFKLCHIMASNGEQTVQEMNKQIVARFSEEFWGKRKADIVDELCSDDFVSHYPMHGRRVGKNEAKKMLREFEEVRELKAHACAKDALTDRLALGIPQCYVSPVRANTHDC